MAKTFTRLGKQIAIAVKAGGPEPENNPTLRSVIATCKRENMPKDNIERAIKNAMGKDQSDYKSMTYEGYGPHGIAVFVDTLTDNTTRTVADVRSVFNKFGGNLGTMGSLAFLFDHKCVFTFKKKDGLDMEELILDLIDYDVEDEYEEDDEEGTITIYGNPKSYAAIQKHLEECGFEDVGGDFTYIPNDLKEVTPEQRETLDKMIERLEEFDDVQTVYTNMQPEEGEEYFLKPMNCPHHCMIYKNSPRSYKDLPLRLAEFGTVCRYEQSGELHGLTRVRSFTQDDAHIFCRPDQVKDEFLRVMDIISIVFESMDFENFEAQISLRDKVNREKYIGSDENWEKAERAIIEACEEKGLKAKIEYGEAAFYGPKLDFMVKDAIGRRWQLGTIQVDYNLPERFQLEYTGADNQKHRPVMVHRAPFGSMERFVAVLIEHTAGKFPLWLTPDQVAILPISEKFNDYAHEVKQYLKRYDIRAIVDERNEKIGRKIRDNEMKRIPYMLVVGEKEAENKEVAVRKQGEGDKGTMKFEEFAKKMNEEVQNMINKW